MRAMPVFSGFSHADWVRLGASLALAGLIFLFAGPIASTLGTTRSFSFLLASIVVFLALSGLAEYLARHHLKRRTKRIVFRAGVGALVLLGVLYLLVREQLAASLDLMPRGADAAAVLIGVIVLQRILHLSYATDELP
jgi:amino acid transporter